MPSLTFLLPSAAPNSPWDHSEVLVETEDIGMGNANMSYFPCTAHDVTFAFPIESPTCRKKRKYTVGDYQQLFDDLICPDEKLRWQATKDINSDFRAPGVEIHCIYGIGVDTPGKLRYKEDKFPNEYPKVEDEDGDGFGGCQLWGNNDDDIWLVKDELKDYMSFADKMA
nr:hypothetical protein BaRGS_022456 [Batillaria attramentaria]